MSVADYREFCRNYAAHLSSDFNGVYKNFINFMIKYCDDNVRTVEKFKPREIYYLMSITQFDYTHKLVFLLTNPDIVAQESSSDSSKASGNEVSTIDDAPRSSAQGASSSSHSDKHFQPQPIIITQPPTVIERHYHHRRRGFNPLLPNIITDPPMPWSEEPYDRI